MRKKCIYLLLLSTVFALPLWAQKVNYKDITPEQLPVGTKVIPKYVFSNREDLVEVVIPEGVEIIEEGAFSYCQNLKKVTLPTTLIRANSAFEYCDSLNDITCLSIVPPSIKPDPVYSYVNLSWAIYKHFGQMRADAQFSKVRVKQTANDIIFASENKPLLIL